MAADEVRPLLPQTPMVVFGGRGYAASQRNLHAISGVKKHRCLSQRNHGQTLFGWRAIARHPILSLVTSENAWFERGEEGLRANFARDMRAAPGAVAGSDSREADAYLLEGHPGGTWW